MDLLDKPLELENDENIEYMLIIHDENFNRLKKYLEENDKITFNAVEATYPYPEMEGPTLSKENKNKLITEYSSRLTKDSIRRLLKGKNFDKIEFLT